MRQAAVTPPALLRRLAIGAGDQLILVGGQSLAYWVGRYGLPLPAGAAAVSNDVDFLADVAHGRWPGIAGLMSVPYATRFTAPGS